MNSIEEIFELYYNDLYKYIFSLVRDKHHTEDILQETFYKAYINIDSYQSDNLKGWLTTIAKNCFIDFFRKQKKIILTSEFFYEVDKNQINIEEMIITNEKISNVAKIINNLPVKQQKAIILKDFKELTYEEGALIMNIKASTFKTLVYRARKSIKLNFKEK
ncbi:RNA polymerase sigma factor [Priestia aryabhattai]|uniref:RNA polymerase sigma factor n=1 Tax=Priestia aryabhattai TaxID=412384 RepID=A0AAX6N3Z2_PRIAR|nr:MULTISPECIES: RNA polymerase sigma factor [Priestia]MDU9690184.1 RNA polymerase sigma factor [Priestia aryabhattai]MED5244037.1 RNA polymerase sigma factor [Priestia sp. LL-8]